MCAEKVLYRCLHVPASHVVFLSAGSPHSLEETEAAGRETGKNNKYPCFLPHTVIQQQWHQSWSTDANWGKEGSQCFRAVVWSRCWVLVQITACSTFSQLAPWLQPSLQISQSSQRLGFNTAIFIALHLCFGKQQRERRLSVGCSVQEKKSRSHPPHEGQTAVFWTPHQRQTLTRDPREKYF